MGRPLMSPDGSRIKGTKELVPGCAMIDPETLRHDDAGTLTFTYVGGTELYWDDAHTVTRQMQTVFIDDDGQEWLASELVEIPEEDDDTAE